MSMNIFGEGHLGGDATLKEVKGQKVLELSVALTTGYGERAKTTWVRASLWGGLAETLLPRLKKGTHVEILLTDCYVSAYAARADNTPRASVDGRVASLQILDRSASASEEAGHQDAPPPDFPDIPF